MLFQVVWTFLVLALIELPVLAMELDHAAKSLRSPEEASQALAPDLVTALRAQLALLVKEGPKLLKDRSLNLMSLSSLPRNTLRDLLLAVHGLILNLDPKFARSWVDDQKGKVSLVAIPNLDENTPSDVIEIVNEVRKIHELTLAALEASEDKTDRTALVTAAMYVELFWRRLSNLKPYLDRYAKGGNAIAAQLPPLLTTATAGGMTY